MSIWGSFFTLGSEGEEPPYIDCVDITDHYTEDKPESLRTTERGGYLDVASSGNCGLFRFAAQDRDSEPGHATIWLSREQVRGLRDALTKELGEDEPVGITQSLPWTEKEFDEFAARWKASLPNAEVHFDGIYDFGLPSLTAVEHSQTCPRPLPVGWSGPCPTCGRTLKENEGT